MGNGHRGHVNHWGRFSPTMPCAGSAVVVVSYLPNAKVGQTNEAPAPRRSVSGVSSDNQDHLHKSP